MSGTRPDTWMPIYWGDYVRDTGHLGAAEHGAYLMMIGHYWTTGKPLPDDDVLLARIARMTPGEWQAARRLLADFFQIADGFWRHKRIEHELEVWGEKIEQKRRAGQASAQARRERQANTEPSAVGTDDPTKSEQNGNAESTSVEHPLNVCSTDVGTEPPTEAQRKGNPSPSPSPSSSDSSLRSESPPLPPLGDRVCVVETNHFKNDPDHPPDESPSPDTPPPKKAEKPRLFDQFWAVYPKQRAGSRSKALLAYKHAMTRATEEEIYEGSKAYANSDPVQRGFAKGAAAWLNDDRWTDKPVRPREALGPGFAGQEGAASRSGYGREPRGVVDAFARAAARHAEKNARDLRQERI